MGRHWFDRYRCLVVAIDPKTPSIIYAIAGNRMFKSVDGGDSWTALNTRASIRSLAIDPRNPNIIYAGTYGGTTTGVLKSTDQGSNWVAINEGLPDLPVLTLAIDPADPKTLYAGTSHGMFKLRHTPLVPTNVSASDGTYVDKVEVTWSVSLRAESYRVYRAKSSDPGAPRTLLGTTAKTFFRDTTAVPGKRYFYWVKASNSSGTSKFSTYDRGYRSDGSPLVPTNVSASNGTYTDKVEVTWTASLRAESYKVYRARSNDPGATKVLLGTTTETIFNDTAAVPGRKYYYWVKASNTIGTTKLSACDKGYR